MVVSHGSGSISRTRCAIPSDPKEQQRRLLYGRRRGRALRPGLRALIGTLLPRISVALPAEGPLDLRSLFGGSPQCFALEIGFGAGEHLAYQAARSPETGFIGCEVFENGIAHLLAEIERQQFANIRIFADDARLLIAALPPASIARVFILFPDPWPKARHHKRRLVSRETLDRLAEIMTDASELRLATDDPGYVSQMVAELTRNDAFLWVAQGPQDWLTRPSDWPSTRYEEKARAAGRTPVFLRFIRRPRDRTTA